MKHAYLASALIFSLLAASMGASIFQLAMGFNPPVSRDPVISVWAVAAAALVTALGFWQVIMVEPRRITWQRGAIAGALTGLAAHPLAFLFSAYISMLRFGPPAQNTPFENLVFPPVLAITLSGFSLLLFGWITVPLGALAGGVVARFFQIRH